MSVMVMGPWTESDVRLAASAGRHGAIKPVAETRLPAPAIRNPRRLRKVLPLPAEHSEQAGCQRVPRAFLNFSSDITGLRSGISTGHFS